MNLRTDLRIAWFADTYLHSPFVGFTLLDAGGTSIQGYSLRFPREKGITYSQLPSLPASSNVFAANNAAAFAAWHTVAQESYDAVIAGLPTTHHEVLRQALHEMTRAVKPGGYVCLVACTPHTTTPPTALSAAPQETFSNAATAKNQKTNHLATLARTCCLTPLHASINLAPLGAAPEWYCQQGNHDLLLVAQKPDRKHSQQVEPFCQEHSQEHDLTSGFVPQSAQPWAQPIPKYPALPTGSAGRINTLLQHYEATSYLELSALPGRTFPAVEAAIKVLVCPQAEQKRTSTESSTLTLPVAFTDFFEQMEKNSSPVCTWLAKHKHPPFFDLIFINGEHTFESSLRDFIRCQSFAHENTLFVLNSSVPCDPYSALPDKKRALAYRRAAGLEGGAWHGDVYKTVFAIHDLFPQYSYCTITEKNSHTVIWQAKGPTRTPAFPSLEHIGNVDYFGMLAHAQTLMPIDPSLLLKLIGKHLTPNQYSRPNAWKQLLQAQPPAPVE